MGVDGICELQSFSDGFRRLINHSTSDLHATYTCVKMYPRQEFPKTQKLFGLIASGRVESLTARVPLVRGTGELIEVFSIMKIEFSDGKPAYLTMCMKEYDPHGAQGDLPFFEPTLVRLRELPRYTYSVQPAPGHSPISIQEIYSPDSTPSPTLVQESSSMPPYPRQPEILPPSLSYPLAAGPDHGQHYYSPPQSYYPPPLGHSPYGQQHSRQPHHGDQQGIGYAMSSRGLLASLPHRTRNEEF